MHFCNLYLNLLIVCLDYASKPIALKYADKLQKDNTWLIPDHIHGYKDLHFAQKINDPRLYYSILRGMHKKNIFFYFAFQILINLD